MRNVLSRLNKDALAVNKWFETNSMVVNPEKFQVMFLGNLDPTSVYITLDNNVNIYGKTEVELLGITIDYKLTFKSHIKRLCRSANNKISALIRFRNLITFDQTRVLINAYILSYFFYCPLIWMFCGKTEYLLIERTHKRALRILQNDFTLSYKQLLEMSGSVSIHVKHLQHLMTEIYKTTNSTNPEFMKQVFKQREGVYYNLRNKNSAYITTNENNYIWYQISFFQRKLNLEYDTKFFERC